MRAAGGFCAQISAPAFGVHIDHIIPIAKGGHPSDIDNLQLAHWTCNRQKSDKIFRTQNGGFGAGAQNGAPANGGSPDGAFPAGAAGASGTAGGAAGVGGFVSNRMLPQSLDWAAYRAR